MDFWQTVYNIFVVILFIVSVLILRTVYVLKKKRNHASLDRRKAVKVMVVAGSGIYVPYLELSFVELTLQM